MPKRTVARHERAIRQIRLRIKARGCTASGRTASYFYIISTWRSRYYVPGLSPVPLHRPPHLCSLFFFFPRKACGIFGNRCNPAANLSTPLYIMFLGGEPRYTYKQKRGFAPLSLSLSSPVRESPLCGRVYAIQAILILIKSAESIVCRWSFYRILLDYLAFSPFAA